MRKRSHRHFDMVTGVPTVRQVFLEVTVISDEDFQHQDSIDSRLTSSNGKPCLRAQHTMSTQIWPTTSKLEHEIGPYNNTIKKISY